MQSQAGFLLSSRQRLIKNEISQSFFLFLSPLKPPQALPLPPPSTKPGLPQPSVGLNPHPFRHCYLHRRLGKLNASPRAGETPWQHSSLLRSRQEMPNTLAVLLRLDTSSHQPQQRCSRTQSPSGLLRHSRHRCGR